MIVQLKGGPRIKVRFPKDKNIVCLQHSPYQFFSTVQELATHNRESHADDQSFNGNLQIEVNRG